MRRLAVIALVWLFLLVAWLGLATAPAGAFSDVEQVNTTADETLAEGAGEAEGEGFCSGPEVRCPLRAALESAANVVFVNVNDIVVLVPAGHYELDPAKGPLPLGNVNSMSCGAAMTACPVTLEGAGAGRTIIDGKNAVKGVEALENAAPVTIKGVTITHGRVEGTSNGGGVGTEKTPLTIRESVVSQSMTGGVGGGVSVLGAPLKVVDSAITGNSAAVGGGIAARGDAPVTLERSTVSGNKTSAALGPGGGGLLLAEGTSRLIDSTIAANSSLSDGGGIDLGVNSVADLRFTTVASNSASKAGGGVGTSGPGEGTLNLEDAILAGNTPDQCVALSGASATGTNIVYGSSSCLNPTPAVLNVDPKLGPLSMNGGLGETFPLTAGSPALNLGGASCPIAPTDQRGTARPRGAGCDLGSFEAAADASVTLSAAPDPVTVGGVLALNATVADLGADPLSGLVLTIPVPAGASLVSAPAGCSAMFAASTTVTCALGTLSAGQTISLAVTVRGERLGPLAETASVATQQADYNLANNVATTASTVAAPAAAGGAAGAGAGGGGGGGGGTRPGGAAAGSGRLSLVGRTFTVDAHGNVTLRLRCSPAASACSGVVALYSRSGRLPSIAAVAKHRHAAAVLLARARVSIAAGASATVRLHLSAAARGLGKAGKSFTPRALISGRDDSGKTISGTYAITVKRAARVGRRHA